MKTWKRIRYVFILLLAFIALFLFTDIYTLFLKPLDTGIEIESPYGDVILVLGGGLKKGRELGYSTEERLKLTVDLFKQKKRTIIVSGGSLYKGSPAIKMISDYFQEHGVDPAYVQFEGKSQTTYDNFIYTSEMINRMKFKEVIVSTSPYHHRRSRMMLSYLGFHNFKISRMKRSEIYQADSIRQRLRNMKLIFREYLAILKFKIFKR